MKLNQPAKRGLNDELKKVIREQLADGVSKATIASQIGVTLFQVAAIQAHVTIAERKKRLTDDELLTRAHGYAKARARTRKWRCLSFSECRKLWESQKGRCDISGVRFSDLVVNPRAKVLSRPWRPSLDRINPKKGYERNNVRLVAQIVNFALGEWPIAYFYEMCERVVKRRRGS